jgi:hypothetical protein
LPFSDRFLDPFSFRDSLSKEFKEGRFSTSNISFNSKAKIVASGFRIDEIFGENLILISR